MKNLFLFLFIMMIFSSQIIAQDYKGNIGISIGPSFPLSGLSSKNINNDAAGFASNGAVIDISFAYKLGKSNYGIMTLLRGQFNPFDSQVFEEEISNQIPGVNWLVDADGWGIGGFMFGGFSSIPISDKIYYESRVLIGFLNATSPEINITGTVPGASMWIKQNSAESTSFAFLVGMGFKFDIYNRLNILTNLDFLSSNPEFRNVETISSDGSREKSTWSQSMMTLSVNVGLALKL